MASLAFAKVQRFVLVIGESGVGKSTIVNMLYNNKTDESSCRQPCATSSRAASVTKALSLNVNLVSGWCLVDSVGVGDRESSPKEIVKGIRFLLQSLVCGVHGVVFVAKMPRLTQESRANLTMLREMFSQRDLKSNSVLVLTHWEGELGEEEESLKEWLSLSSDITGAEDAKAANAKASAADKSAASLLQNLVDGFGKVILTNNSLEESESYPECREKCLSELRTFIENCHNKVMPQATSWREIISRLFKRLSGRWGRGGEVSVDELLASGAADTYCGDCQLCKDPLEVCDALALPCKHAFHHNCLRSFWLCGCRSCPTCESAMESHVPFPLQ